MIGDVQLLPLLGMLNLLGWAFGYHVQDFLVNVPSSTKTMEVCWNLETILPIGPTGKIHAEVVQITSYTAVLEFFWPASKKKRWHIVNSVLGYEAAHISTTTITTSRQRQVVFSGKDFQLIQVLSCFVLSLDHLCILGWIWRISYQYIGSGPNTNFHSKS